MPSEQTRKRLQNQSQLLDFLRRTGQVQRARISRELGIRNSSVTNITRELLDRNILSAVQPEAYRSPLVLNTSYWLAGAISIQADFCSAAVVDVSGQIHAEKSTPTPTGSPEEVISAASDLLRQILQSSGHAILGIGVSLPGIVDPATGVTTNATNIKGWEGDMEVGQAVSAATGTGCLVDNDAANELLGNIWFQPWGSSLTSAVYLCIHDGIGCSQIVDRKPSHGSHHAVGEIGCLPSGDEGRTCQCGRRDCLQTYCSEPALLATVLKSHPELEGNSLEEVSALAAKSSKVAQSFKNALQPLAEKLATIIAFADPDGIVISASNKPTLEFLARTLQEGIHERLPPTCRDKTTVFIGFPYREAGLLGAAATVFGESFLNQDARLLRGAEIAE